MSTHKFEYGRPTLRRNICSEQDEQHNLQQLEQFFDMMGYPALPGSDDIASQLPTADPPRAHVRFQLTSPFDPGTKVATAVVVDGAGTALDPGEQIEIYDGVGRYGSATGNEFGYAQQFTQPDGVILAWEPLSLGGLSGGGGGGSGSDGYNFRLDNDKSLHESSATVSLLEDDLSDSGINATVYDPNGTFEGKAGHTGYAAWVLDPDTETSRLEIVRLNAFALFVRGVLAGDMLGSATLNVSDAWGPNYQRVDVGETVSVSPGLGCHDDLTSGTEVLAVRHDSKAPGYTIIEVCRSFSVGCGLLDDGGIISIDPDLWGVGLAFDEEGCSVTLALEEGCGILIDQEENDFVISIDPGIFGAGITWDEGFCEASVDISAGCGIDIDTAGGGFHISVDACDLAGDGLYCDESEMSCQLHVDVPEDGYIIIDGDGKLDLDVEEIEVVVPPISCSLTIYEEELILEITWVTRTALGLATSPGGDSSECKLAIQEHCSFPGV